MEAFFLCVPSALCLCAERSACPVANLTLSGKKTLLLFLFLLFFTLVSLHLPFGITDLVKLFWASNYFIVFCNEKGKRWLL